MIPLRTHTEGCDEDLEHEDIEHEGSVASNDGDIEMTIDHVESLFINVRAHAFTYQIS